MKNSLKNFILLFVGFSVSVILSEIAVRIVAPQRVFAGRVRFEPDDYLVFRLARNFSTVYSLGEFQVTEATNSIGLRDREIGPKQPGSYRFLGLGDSFSFASGVELEETYFKRLEWSLTDIRRQPIEIINCAAPAYSLLQEVRFLKKYGMQFQPNAAIIGYYVGNDFLDSYDLFDAEGKPTTIAKDGQLVTRYLGSEQNLIRHSTAMIRGFLATHSHFYCFLRDRLSSVLVQLGLAKPPDPPDFCAKQYNEHMKKGWELNLKLLQEAAEFARAHNLRLIVVVLPVLYQVYDEIWHNEIRRLRVDGTLYDLEKPNRMVSEACSQIGIECVDVLPALRHKNADQNLFYRIDSHMTARGHSVVADTLTKYFAEHPDTLIGAHK